jgi:hypothetical protein
MVTKEAASACKCYSTGIDSGFGMAVKSGDDIACGTGDPGLPGTGRFSTTCRMIGRQYERAGHV